MGGGRGNLLPDTVADPEYPERTGQRRDGRNVIKEWLERKRGQGKRATYVWNKEQFDKVNPQNTDNLIGVSIKIY